MWGCTAKGPYRAPDMNQMNKTLVCTSNLKITIDFFSTPKHLDNLLDLDHKYSCFIHKKTTTMQLYIDH